MPIASIRESEPPFKGGQEWYKVVTLDMDTTNIQFKYRTVKTYGLLHRWKEYKLIELSPSAYITHFIPLLPLKTDMKKPSQIVQYCVYSTILSQGQLPQMLIMTFVIIGTGNASTAVLSLNIHIAVWGTKMDAGMTCCLTWCCRLL
jgi:hypothetical protein